jgi:aerobic-type carbon monoxide dehydrogenase small subunit (CoxS/CutS family)
MPRGAAVPGADGAHARAEARTILPEMKRRGISLVVNGTRRMLHVHPLKRLLDVLREECGLTGTKEGCGEGECGACTVLVDGEAVNACLVPVAQVDRARVTTIEGLGGRHPLQRAFVELGGAQCGICTPGMIMAAVALGPRPSLEAVRVGLAGNLCRCTGYSAIYRSVQRAAGNGRERKERGGRGTKKVRTRKSGSR